VRFADTIVKARDRARPLSVRAAVDAPDWQEVAETRHIACLDLSLQIDLGAVSRANHLPLHDLLGDAAPLVHLLSADRAQRLLWHLVPHRSMHDLCRRPMEEAAE